MYFVKTHINKIVKEDFLLKYRKKSPCTLPTFSKLSLSAKFNEDNKESVLTLIEIISFHKAYLTRSKVNTLSLNLRKGDLVGCKLVLKKKSIYEFLDRFVFEMLSASKKFEGFKSHDNYIYWQIKDVFVLEETNLIFIYLQSASTLDIVIIGKNANSNFFQSNRFPILDLIGANKQ